MAKPFVPYGKSLTGSSARQDIGRRIRIEKNVFRRCGFRVCLAKKALLHYWISGVITTVQYRILRDYVDKVTDSKPESRLSVIERNELARRRRLNTLPFFIVRA